MINVHQIKHRTVILALITLMLLSPDFKIYISQTPKEWTFMVYMDADNNLEDAGIDDLNEMEFAGSTTDVNIIVLLDRIPGYDSSNGDWTTTKIYYVTYDPDGVDGTIDSQELLDAGEKNMGDPATLIWYVEWVIANYPAQKYAVILWDHGSGWRRTEESRVKAVCVDDTSNDELTTWELKTAFNQIYSDTGVIIDLLGFDACLMHNTEVDYQLREHINVFVASEETEPWDGWPYDWILENLTSDPTMTPEELGAVIADKYIQSYITGHQSGSDVTQSAVKKEELINVSDAVDYFAQQLINKMLQYHAEMEQARNNVQEFYYTYYIDLYHYAELIYQQISDPDIREAAQWLMENISKAVIYEGHDSGNPNAHGLSIYFPATQTEYDSQYENLDFAADTNWDEFLNLYYNPPTAQYDVAVTSLEAPPYVPPGTTIKVNGTITNQGSREATNIEVNLLINGSIEDTTTIPTLTPGASQKVQFQWTPTEEADYNITIAAILVGDEIPQNNWMSKIVTTTPKQILLVEDDNQNTVRNSRGDGSSPQEFQQILDSLGYTYIVWRETTDGRPTIEFMSQFPVVIWTCGDLYGGTIDDQDQQLLAGYVFGGGCLLLEGDDIGYDHQGSGDWFMNSVAHATYVADHSNTGTYVTVLEDHPITQGLPSQIYLSGGDGCPWPDEIQPVNGSIALMGYTSWTTGYSLTAYNGSNGDGKVVYMAFSLDGLAQEYQQQLVQNIIEWLLPPGEFNVTVVEVSSDKYAYDWGEAATIQVTVNVSNGPRDVYVWVEIYNDTWGSWTLAHSDYMLVSLPDTGLATYTFTWIVPSGEAGHHMVKAGVSSSDWSTLYDVGWHEIAVGPSARVVSLTLDRDPPYYMPGEAVTVNLTIEADGARSVTCNPWVESHTTDWDVEHTGYTTVTLNPGDTYSYIATYILPSDASGGWHAFKGGAATTDWQLIYDITGTVGQLAPYLVQGNIVVVEVQTDKDSYSPGETVYITMVVDNQGSNPVLYAGVWFEIKDADENIYGGEWRQQDLPLGQSSVEFQWVVPDDMEPGDYRVVCGVYNFATNEKQITITTRTKMAAVIFVSLSLMSLILDRIRKSLLPFFERELK